MQSLILDTWPLLAFFEEESSAAAVEDIILESRESEKNMMISVVNLGEVWYTVARAYSGKDADRTIKEIKQLRITIEPAEWLVTKKAAGFKSKGGISYADCFAAALAKHHNAPLVTGDPEFKQFEKEIEIIWV